MTIIDTQPKPDVPSKRLEFIDILKGFLIIMVVIGHGPNFIPKIHHYIFWFHMPAFLMVSGLFLKTSYILKDELKKKFIRLVIPYLFFSILLGTIARKGNLFKQIIGTIWGGNANVTYCTFPYYFINMLFCTFCLYYILYSLKCFSKHKWGITVALYVVIHLVACYLPDSLLGWLPWNFDLSINALLYLMIGKKIAKRGQYLSCNNLFCSVIILVMIFALDYGNVYIYNYDMKHHIWMMGLDVILPIACMNILFAISIFVSKLPFLNRLLSYIGKCSLVILLLHPLFIKIYSYMFDNISSLIPLLANVLSCMFVHWLFGRNKYSRMMIGENR